MRRKRACLFLRGSKGGLWFLREQVFLFFCFGAGLRGRWEGGKENERDRWTGGGGGRVYIKYYIIGSEAKRRGNAFAVDFGVGVGVGVDVDIDIDGF